MIAFTKIKGYLFAALAALIAGAIFTLKVFKAGKQAHKTETLEQQRKIEKDVDDAASEVRDQYKEKLKNARATGNFGSFNDS
ncbi:MAG: hypothetical protein SV201_05720 [Pseudomonadota bacterium]|nr:hypothetical protein [Pseudomonadota bacterium]